MITQTFIELLADLAEGILGLIPSWTLPTWYSTATTFWADTAADVQDMAYWVPVSALAQVGLFVFATTAVAITVKIARVLISMFTGGGGSAA